MSITVRLGDRLVGEGSPVFVIAELSANHGGNLDRTLDLVSIAAARGADAVKIQTYTPDTMTIDSDDARFVVGPGNPWSGRRLHDLYAEAAMPWDWYPALAERAHRDGILLFSTPFDRTAVDYLVDCGASVLKIASFELTDLPLIRYAAATELPLVMSTGMASDVEIEEAVAAARASGDGGVALLRCNSAYPSPVEQMDLASIPDMRVRWGVPVGLSDHTLDDTAAVVSVALGACIVEKHFTRDRSDGGPDSSFSLEPDELGQLVTSIRSAEASLGNVRYGPSDSDRGSLRFRRSVYVVADVAAGEEFTYDNVGTRRPLGVLEPRHLDAIIGRRAVRALRAGHALDWVDLA
ncbi:MAG: pseudaminic acid synthase [Microthrixaceae bacterium]|nr:pseudaminic acid synthase [Microthrixaceae bacterium]